MRLDLLFPQRGHGPQVRRYPQHFGRVVLVLALPLLFGLGLELGSEQLHDGHLRAVVLSGQHGDR